jgi:hypothetical protein
VDDKKTPPRSLHAQLDQEALRRIGRGLANAFDQLAVEFKANQARREEAREVSALFEVHRARRWADADGSPDRERRPEMDAQLAVALDGYSTSYLSDLCSFGEWLADAAGTKWRSRIH